MNNCGHDSALGGDFTQLVPALFQSVTKITWRIYVSYIMLQAPRCDCAPLPTRMGTVAEAALPLYSSNHLQLLPTSSVRRRRFITAVVLLAGFASLVFCHHYLFVRQRPAHVPLSIDIDPDPTVALSPLGLEAEKVYHLGSLSISDYNSSLQAFIDAAFPLPLKARLSKQLHRYLDLDSSEPLPERPNTIWQTNDILPVNKDTQSWQYTNPDYKHNFLYDDDAQKWVHQHFKNSAIEWTWNTLPHAVLVSTTCSALKGR